MDAIRQYFDQGIATYERDPPANDYQRGHLDALKTARAELAAVAIPMLLFCPRCGAQHVDAPDKAKGWENPPHRSHLCDSCGIIWRPADVPTTGVAEIASLSERDTWSVGRGCVPVDTELGDCELCSKPLLRGQFVNQYDDVGTAHANCDDPFEAPAEPTPSPEDDGTTMPTYALLGKPALLYDAEARCLA
jgi:hypothetical protein